MLKEITVYSRNKEDVIFRAFQNGEKVEFDQVNETIKPAIERWAQYGLIFMVKLGEESYPAVSYVEESGFLDCLKDYLTRTSGFVIVSVPA